MQTRSEPDLHSRHNGFTYYTRDQGRGYFQVLVISPLGKLAGRWEYEFRRKKLTSINTEVFPRYQRRGIAKRLWAIGIELHKPAKIESLISSDRGNKLVQSIEKKYPKISFEIERWENVTLCCP